MNSNDILRNNVKYYRVKQEMTQGKCAELMGVSEKHYSHLEKGKYSYTLDTLDVVAKILGKESWELLKERHSADEVPSRVDLYIRQRNNENKS